jgi:hypothetical protein
MNLNTMANHFTKSKLALALSASLALVGCGGSGQDDGSVSGTKTTFSGQAIDGYLARATVFIDSNNNGTRDAWEAFAFTDNDGYYSYNPLTDTDYCAGTASAQEQQYCLVSNVEHANVVVRIDGGYDVLTGEPFLGQMSRRVNAQVPDEITDTVVSPITSLFTNLETSTDRDSLLSSLGLEDDALDVDYLNTDGAGNIDATLLNTALKIHKVVAVLSDRLTDTYTEIGEDFATPNDATSAVYPSLAQQIINAGSTLDSVLESESRLKSVLDAAEDSLREVYERKDFDLPSDMGGGDFDRVVDVVSRIPAVTNSLIDVNDLNFDLSDAKGSSRALESLIIKSVNEASTPDTSIDNAIAFFNDSANRSLIDTLTDALSQEMADITSLSNNDFTGDDFDSVEDLIAASTLPVGTTPFTAIAGKQIRVSDLDLGSGPSDLEDKELEIYFNGQAGDVDGSFTTCVKFIDGASSDGSLGEGNTRGELAEGFWSLLGASSSDVQSYSLLLTLTFLGTTYQTIMKPAGEEIVGGITYKRVRFDFDGDLESFHSENGVVDIESIPTTNADCEGLLPSRIGL